MLWGGFDSTQSSCVLFWWSHLYIWAFCDIREGRGRVYNYNVPVRLTHECGASVTGVILRDSHGVAQVRFVTGNKILRILKSKALAPDLPEDLYHLIKKAVAVRKHLERNRKDKDAKFRLILIESRIHRLARYYKTRRVLPPNWKYESSTASALVA
ncbi:ribosomal protein S13 L homeolog isoform X1 [Xenopus laevis]|uniref:Ribosomal protein S13 L homeolog isoform X1 n=1 Tax=Xenopus laevis TaxID=8355 RepID=A0A8J1MTC9_XENLA|nr:ribosomal protein S13 L homeolog isoform X1 [Xenopus laevis]